MLRLVPDLAADRQPPWQVTLVPGADVLGNALSLDGKSGTLHFTCENLLPSDTLWFYEFVLTADDDIRIDMQNIVASAGFKSVKERGNLRSANRVGGTGTDAKPATVQRADQCWLAGGMHDPVHPSRLEQFLAGLQ